MKPAIVQFVTELEGQPVAITTVLRPIGPDAAPAYLARLKAAIQAVEAKELAKT